MTFAERFPSAANNPAELDDALDAMIDIAVSEHSSDIRELVCGAVWAIRFMRTYMEKCAHEAQYDAASELWENQELGS